MEYAFESGRKQEDLALFDGLTKEVYILLGTHCRDGREHDFVSDVLKHPYAGSECPGVEIITCVNCKKSYYP